MKPGVSDNRHTHIARKRRPRSSLGLGGLVLAAVVRTRGVRQQRRPR
jgi:hypothetical protein